MQSEQKDSALVAKIGAWATIVWIVASVALLPLNWRLAVGVALGAGVGLAMFHLYRWLAPALLFAASRRRALALLWLVWTVKLPVIGLVLYYAVSRKLASPAGLALGIGLIPVVATVVAVRALLAQAREERMRRGMQAP